MCGISAIIINNNIKNNVINFRQEILKMNNLISHRVPDDEGYFELVHKTNKTRFYFGDITPQDVIKNESKDKIFKHITDKDINENSSVLLGHRRLSIIDLSISAHQPLNDINDNYTIVFNGEIYNFSELKTELISSGAKFKSDSDNVSVATLILPINNKNEIDEILESKSISSNHSQDIKISFIHKNKAYQFDYKLTKNGYSLK